MSLKLMRDVYAHAHSSQAEGCAACTPVGRAVLLAIIFHSGKDVRECWPSVDLLALETCVTTRSVQSALALLGSQGFISIEKRVGRGKTSIYRLNEESIAKGEPASPITQSQKVNQFHPIASEKGESDAPFESDCDPERVNVTTEKGERGALKGERSAKPPDPLKGRTERTERNSTRFQPGFPFREKEIAEPTSSNGRTRPTTPWASIDDLVKDGFSYFLEATGRHADQYRLDHKRLRVGIAGFQALVLFAKGRADPDPLDRARLMFRVAVDRMCASPFHSGDNASSTRYQDWHHLFSSKDYRSPGKLLEHWLDDERWKPDQKPKKKLRAVNE